MIDNRGAYKSLPTVEHQEVRDPRPHRFCHAFTFTSRPCRILLRTLISLPIIITFIYGYNHAVHSGSSPDDQHQLADSHLQHLASPLRAQNVSLSGKASAYVVGRHHRVSGDFPPDYEWIDPSSRVPFNEVMMSNGMNNNAMARMPAGSPYDMMVVGRGWNNLYIDETEGITYANLTLVGFFVNYEPLSGSWIRAGPEPYILDLPIWRQYPRPCENLINGGPADPRLIWSDAGEPLAIIGTSSRVPGVCKSVGMADLRAIWPGLKSHLEEIGYGDIPIRFKAFTEIGKLGERAQYEKNWAAFFPGPKPAISEGLSGPRKWLGSKYQRGPSEWPFFATQIADRTIVRVNEKQQLAAGRSKDSYVMAEPMDLSVGDEEMGAHWASSQCIFDAMPQDWNETQFHLATPFYRVTFCPRGTCQPSRQNTVLLGLIHYKASPKSYRRMFVTTKVDSPFEIISVSPPLHFGAAASDLGVVFSVSMAFLPTQESHMIGRNPFAPSVEQPGGWLAHGWLDDTMVVGAGLRDEAYDAIHLPVSMALQGHTLCRMR